MSGLGGGPVSLSKFMHDVVSLKLFWKHFHLEDKDSYYLTQSGSDGELLYCPESTDPKGPLFLRHNGAVAGLPITDTTLSVVTPTTSPHTVAATTQVLLVNSPVTSSVVLPTAGCVAGRKLVIKDIGSANLNPFVVSTEGSETIYGDTAVDAVTFDVAGMSMELTSDGDAWYVTAAFIPSV